MENERCGLTFFALRYHRMKCIQFADLSNKVLIRHSAENSILDMEMLSLCKHKILSNSTFAFWAGWIGKKEKEIVIAPKYSLIKQDQQYELQGMSNWRYLEP